MARPLVAWLGCVGDCGLRRAYVETGASIDSWLIITLSRTPIGASQDLPCVIPILYLVIACQPSLTPTVLSLSSRTQQTTAVRER